MDAIGSRRLRTMTLCAPALAAVVAAITAGVAQAAVLTPAGRLERAVQAARAAHAVRPGAASFGGQARLASVSCRSASWCMAVGSYATADQVRHSLAMIWTGASWRKLKNPRGAALKLVACSSPRFCMAWGGPTGAERWNGTTWRTVPGPKGGLPSLTCASRALCMRIHGTLASVWNGSSWRDAKATNVCSGSAPGPCGMASVSCGGPASCVTVGTWTVSQEPVQESFGFFWNGKTWTRTGPPGGGNPAAADSISCRGGFCMEAGEAFSEVAGGGIAVAGAWDASTTTWTDVSPNLGTLCTGPLAMCPWAGSIACASKASCMTLGGSKGGQFWNGSTWTSAEPVSAGPGSALQAVSCAGSDCLAVGWRMVAGKQRTLAEMWNGSAWSIITSPLGA